MANGDLADSAGLAVFPSGQDLRQGYDNDNIRGDELAAHMLTGTHEMADIIGLDAALDAKQAALGYAPVQQGTGVGQAPAGVVKIGYVIATGKVDLQVDATDFGPIRFEGNGDFGSTPIVTPYGRANPVSSGYVVAYLNSDGRLGASPSAKRFKQNIQPAEYLTLEQIGQIQLVTYRLKSAVKDLGQGAPTQLGVIAEQLIDIGLAQFVIFDEDGETFSVDYAELTLLVSLSIAHHLLTNGASS